MPTGADNAEDLVVVGRVVKPHGIRGELVVEVLSDVPERIAPGVALWLGDEPTEVRACRPHQGRLLVLLAGCADRSAAERLRGVALRAPAVPLEEFETYFAHEIIGAVVRDEHGRDLGEVTALIELPEAAGYDLLEVRRADGSTWLLPAVEDYVALDESAPGQLELRLVDPPGGLVEPVDDEQGPAQDAP